MDARKYFELFGPPEGPYLILRGYCHPEGPAGQRYPHAEGELCGRPLEAVVQCTVTQETNGVRVWLEHKGEWFPESSHYKNTLLNDPEFDALISPHLIFEEGV